ncbi:MarR family winged helix-turn-helix transcriptional regulator [Sporolactobacillus laevolacticus]|uniref:MarR family transcriptional regulator n=1 Tax=Sporolactobacillus laevolacticus DSM 442 TaxID=1395513 RepID=V6IYS8_9BACL|nr:MarR family transcriptional regulator [Sporolactobacillus laevolacticus]EST12612.1 MarR family transcriptional regulator [Sporolactobacillus laevolacticus DSM 442]
MGDFLKDCLYFTTNRLSRVITKMADEEFATTGFSPMYGYLLLLVIRDPGSTQKKLADQLDIAPSTLTRFIEKLEGKGLVNRTAQGKSVLVYPTENGKALEEEIRMASKRLHNRYEQILGKETAGFLSKELVRSSDQLEE